MKKQAILLAVLVLTFINSISGQVDTCINKIQKHEIQSKYLNQTKEIWVSFPLNYDTTQSYPVIYVLDGQWRFDLIRPIAFDLGGNKKMPGHIIVGLPHADWQKSRGVDYTFSHSRIEYNAEKVDSLTYNETNSGGGEAFYLHLTKEVMKTIDTHYPSNGTNVLVGHSYGGYFGSYILSRESGFTAFQIYDPSIWFSNGEAIEMIQKNLSREKEIDVFVSYQPVPEFHATKIEELLSLLSTYPKVKLTSKKYTDETHNSLFMYSFLEGMESLYKDWKEEEEED